ncbi:MAG: stage III sporulation protein AB [Oscillospiraceae bacterium]|nr:stage III sporulation protein AB [Oscillospiraceae bacterium]
MAQAEEYLRAVRLLPPGLRAKAAGQTDELLRGAEELRLRVGQAPTAVFEGREQVLDSAHCVTPEELALTLELATRSSAHTYADSIRMGYVTAPSGVRLGLCGTAVTEGESISGLRRLSSICIRIPHQVSGCAETVFPRISRGGFASTLIVSPPGGGKTTLLREIVRKLSEGGRRVSLIDSRNEVAGVFEGRACFDVGSRTDVLSGAPKAQGIYLVLRAMSPEVIAFDELTAPEDVKACEEAANCGVGLLATAHAAGLEDLRSRPLYEKLLERRIFKYAVVISSLGSQREYRTVEL